MKLLCPHCERQLDERHRKDGCSVRFTRRFLFGLLSGAAAAMALPDVWRHELIVRAGDILRVNFTGTPPLLSAACITLEDEYSDKTTVFCPPECLVSRTNPVFLSSKAYRIVGAKIAVGGILLDALPFVKIQTMGAPAPPNVSITSAR